MAKVLRRKVAIPRLQHRKVQTLRHSRKVGNKHNDCLYREPRSLRVSIMQINAPQHVRDWLFDRTLDERVLLDAGVNWSMDGQIVIPVRDILGVTIFNKYRRDPMIDVGPKYKYDAGSGAALFGIETLAHGDRPVLICEGELDALVARSHGFIAVSSTGGAGTFLPEWASLFEKRDTTILYDNDKAGAKGALTVQAIVPHARIATLPDRRNVKDLTDYCVYLRGQQRSIDGAIQKMIETAVRYEMWPIFTVDTKKEKEDMLRTCNSCIRFGEDRRRERKMHDMTATTFLPDAYILFWENRIQDIKASMKRTAKREIDLPLIEGAKQVPMSEYLKFTRDGFAQCPFHTEDSPSFHWIRKSNKGHCFGCGKTADVIEVVAKLEGIKYIEAAKKIMHK